jgi:hypothetical protein
MPLSGALWNTHFIIFYLLQTPGMEWPYYDWQPLIGSFILRMVFKKEQIPLNQTCEKSGLVGAQPRCLNVCHKAWWNVMLCSECLFIKLSGYKSQGGNASWLGTCSTHKHLENTPDTPISAEHKSIHATQWLFLFGRKQTGTNQCKMWRRTWKNRKNRESWQKVLLRNRSTMATSDLCLSLSGHLFPSLFLSLSPFLWVLSMANVD